MVLNEPETHSQVSLETRRKRRCLTSSLNLSPQLANDQMNFALIFEQLRQFRARKKADFSYSRLLGISNQLSWKRDMIL